MVDLKIDPPANCHSLELPQVVSVVWWLSKNIHFRFFFKSEWLSGLVVDLKIDPPGMCHSLEIPQVVSVVRWLSKNFHLGFF